MELDHLAVSGETLDEAVARVEDALGVTMAAGGRHDVFFTHNRLIGLEDGLYLEAIAIDPDAPAPGRPRWFDLDRFSGPARLTNWICRSDDIEATLEGMPPGAGTPVALRRGDLRWRMAVPASGVLPYDNCWPALMQWDVDDHPAKRLPPTGVRLRRLTVRHPQGADLAAALAPLLGDDRIAVETGPVGLSADFDTPHGPRSL